MMMSGWFGRTSACESALAALPHPPAKPMAGFSSFGRKHRRSAQEQISVVQGD
jgi:hypothetical protein